MAYSQANLEQLFRLIGSLPQQEYGALDSLEFIKTKNSVWPNQLYNLSVQENDFEDVFNAIEIDIERGVIPNLLMVNRDSISQVIKDLISAREYKSSTRNAMTHQLGKLRPSQTISDFQIKEVQSNRELGAWLKIVEAELMGGKALNADIFKALLKSNQCYFYLGVYANQPVATALLFVHDNSAGVYLISTTESFRKKGLGRAITRHCLLKAKALQCNRVDLQATDTGKGVYTSLGFVEMGAIDVFRIKKY